MSECHCCFKYYSTEEWWSFSDSPGICATTDHHNYCGPCVIANCIPEGCKQKHNKSLNHFWILNEILIECCLILVDLD